MRRGTSRDAALNSEPTFLQLPGKLHPSCVEAWRRFLCAPAASRETAAAAVAADGSAQSIGWAGLCLAYHLARAGNVTAAQDALAASQCALAGIDDRRGLDIGKVVEAYVDIVRGEASRAVEALEAVAAGHAAAPAVAPLDRFLVHHALALAHSRLGDLERVIHYHYVNMVMLERCGYMPALGVVLLNLSSTLAAIEDWDESHATAVWALRCCEAMDNPALRRRVEINVALAERFRGHIEEAVSLLERLRAEPMRDPGSDFALFINSAEALAIQGRLAEASACLVRARESATTDPHQVANCEWIAGLIAAKSCDTPGAVRHLEAARESVQQLTSVHVPILPRIVEQLAACYAQGGDHERAFATYQRFHEVYAARLRYTTRARTAGRQLRDDALSLEWPGLNEALRRSRPMSAAVIEQPPQPTIEVRVLGRFDVRVNGEAVRFGRKAPAKPLALLKYLAAQGDREPPEGEIADALWPDQDGDVALGSLAVNLHRLRRLLGDSSAVVHRNRRIGLDPRRVWSDAHEFERVLDRMATATEDSERLRLTQDALELYRGHFLAGEEDSSWTIPLRERFRTRLVSACAAQAAMLAADGRMEDARAFFVRGMQVDDGVEELCLGAMRCSLALGKAAAGIAAYRALEHTLAERRLGRPAAAIRALYERLLAETVHAPRSSVPDL